MEAVGHGRWICGGPGRGSGPLHEASRASGRLCPGGTGIAEVGGQGKALASTQSTQIPYEGALHIHPDTPYQSCKSLHKFSSIASLHDKFSRHGGILFDGTNDNISSNIGKPMDQRKKITEGLRKYLNVNTKKAQLTKISGRQQKATGGICIPLNASVRKESGHKISELTVHVEMLEEEEQRKHKMK